MAQELKEFAGGMKSQREHFNEIVRVVNDLVKRVVALENPNQNPLVCRVNNLDNTGQLLIELRDALVLKVDPLFCCSDGSGSDGSHGGA